MVCENLAHENYVFVQIELHVQFSSSMTCQCYSIYKLRGKHCLLEAIRATNECGQTAQLEEGERQGLYNEPSCMKQAETHLWYFYRNVLTGFMLTCFSMIYLVSTTLTRTDSIS